MGTSTLGIALYWAFVILSLYASYVFLFRSYKKKDFISEEYEKTKFPLILYIGLFGVSFIPVGNVICFIILVMIMFVLEDCEDYYFKTIFFKKF